MTEGQWERAYDIVNEIEKQYGKREGAQPDVANCINEKYNAMLTTEDIADITKQLGYYHTVMRKKEKPVVIFLNESFKKHIE